MSAIPTAQFALTFQSDRYIITVQCPHGIEEQYVPLDFTDDAMRDLRRVWLDAYTRLEHRCPAVDDMTQSWPWREDPS